MDYRYIEQLLDRYFAGETSLEEEETLRNALAHDDEEMPQSLRQWVPLMAAMNEQPTLDDSFDQRILVPFSPEAPLSGVNRQVRPEDLAWYRRTFDAPEMGEDDVCLLHFEAVDYACCTSRPWTMPAPST